MSLRQHASRGFTLLEMSVVLVLIGLVVSGGLVIFATGVQKSQRDLTLDRMQKIDTALLNFVVANRRLPCPASVILLPSDTNYGVEAAVPGTCTGSTPAATFTATNGVVEGAVPTRALGLPDDYMYDGWGRRTSYAVDPTVTVYGTLPTAQCGVCIADPITVLDVNGNTLSSAASYVLTSHGSEGHGGYTSNGVAYYTGNGNAQKLANCHCNSNTSQAAFTATYYQAAPNYASGEAGVQSYYFDDIVSYREPWQLQTPTMPLSTAQNFLFVADISQNNVQQFCASNGQYIRTITGVASPWGMALDGGCNLWVTNQTGSNITVFSRSSSYSTLIETIGSIGTANGQFMTPRGIALDAFANIWVADRSNQRIQELSSTGTYINSMGTVGTQSSAPGQFVNPPDVAVNGLGNVWVGDFGNGRLQKFTAAGGFLFSVPPVSICNQTLNIGSVPQVFACPYGPGNSNTYPNGYFYPGVFAMGGIAIDAGNNIWATDYTNNRVQQFDTNGNWIMTIPTSGCSSSTVPACPAGSGSTLTLPTDVAVDASGNIWILDRNERVAEFNQNGNYIQSVGSSGSGNGQFTAAYHIMVGR